MSNLRIFSILIFLFFFSFFVHAEIKEVTTVDQISSAFANADDKTLGIFDVDEVLVVSQEPSFQRNVFGAKDKIDFVRNLKKQFNVEQFYLLINLSLLRYDSEVFDPKMPILIQELQKQKIKLIALTASANHILLGHSLADRRYAVLQKLGMNFSNAFPCYNEIIFSDLALSFGEYPSYKKGILFTNGESFKNGLGNIAGNSKGDVLISFLNHVNWFPNYIVFVDDKIENVEDVQDKLAEKYPEIKFVGLHYTAVVKMPPKFIENKDFEAKWQALADEITSGRCSWPNRNSSQGKF